MQCSSPVPHREHWSIELNAVCDGRTYPAPSPLAPPVDETPTPQELAQAILDACYAFRTRHYTEMPGNIKIAMYDVTHYCEHVVATGWINRW